MSSLTLRIISGLVMLPVAIAAIWVGGWVFAALVAIAAGLMCWEWQGLCGRSGADAILLSALAAVGPLLIVLTGVGIAIVGLLAGGLLVSLALGGRHRFFVASGFAYILVACVGTAWLRGLGSMGMETIFWLVAVVVLTDTCAYFTGRSLGGPKLAPKISPKKTWSGLVGGIVGAAVGGGVGAAVIGASILQIAVMGGLFAIIAQIGDLAVSKAKRAFDVKDSSNLIPGHGGVLDRFDGILSTSLAMMILTLAGGGSPLVWL